MVAAFVAAAAVAQINPPKNKAVFLELGGSGGLASVNFEKTFLTKNKKEFTWRAGLSFAPIDKNNGTSIVVPLIVNVLAGQHSHKLELGLGQGLTLTTKGNFFALTTAVVGYRYQSPLKRWFYRVTYTPLISYLVDFQVQHWGGLSIGYRLNN